MIDVSFLRWSTSSVDYQVRVETLWSFTIPIWRNDREAVLLDL